jgi:hypothetical protein
MNFEANSEDFVFDNEMIVQGVLAGLRFEEVPVRTHYATDSSSVGFQTSVRYGLGCLRVMIESVLHRTGLVTFKRYPRTPPRLAPAELERAKRAWHPPTPSGSGGTAQA